MPKIKNFKSKIVISVVVLLFCLVCYTTKIGCPILHLTGIRCLGCGMTRALIAALKFDFYAAFSHHIMFWSVPLLYICFLLDGKLFKNKTLNIIFYLFVLIGFIINWII